VAAPEASSGRKDAATLVVQVNQVALEKRGPKVAVIEYSGAAIAGRFEVLKDGKSVAAGTLEPSPPFTEWGAGKKYFEADFSNVQSVGRHELKVVVADARTASAPFVIAERATFTTTAASLVDYFKANRYLDERDRHIRVFDTQRYVNVWGGWKDAGGDTGKYLSHLSFANFFNPQQAAMAVWTLAKSYELAPEQYREAGLDQRVIAEAMWGADFLHRMLDSDGYFYETIFDRWGEPGAERVVTGYEGLDGVYSTNYNAAFREGGGIAIAALARASMLGAATGRHGEFTATDYLADAERAFAHLEKNNSRYCDDGVENIIDDYTALLAATELYRATSKTHYLEAARLRAMHLTKRMTPEGWFISDAGSRPYYHAVEAGFPVISLAFYFDIETDAERRAAVRATIRKALDYQLELDRKVSNPYNYARQAFRTFKDGALAVEREEGFFMPHANETKYWWQGESARLASLAVAAVIGGRIARPDPTGTFGVNALFARFAQNQLDWTLGRNPYGMCMLYGFGRLNPPHAESAGDMVAGGISNGITGAVGSDDGRGIAFAAGPDEENWRWVEQWLPHTTWFLLAATVMAQ
jgi:hypothetical protein